MKLAMAFAAIASFSGCASAGLSTPIFGTQQFGYPRLDLPTPPAAPEAVAPEPSAVPAAIVPAAVPGRVAEPPLPVYDERRDPVITAVLLLEGTDMDGGFDVNPDGTRKPLPPSPKLTVIDVSEARAVLGDANP